MMVRNYLNYIFKSMLITEETLLVLVFISYIIQIPPDFTDREGADFYPDFKT